MRHRVRESIKKGMCVRPPSPPLYSMGAFSSSRVNYVFLREVCLYYLLLPNGLFTKDYFIIIYNKLSYRFNKRKFNQERGQRKYFLFL